MKRKQFLWMLLFLFFLSGCGFAPRSVSDSQMVELVVFAAGSLTEAFTEMGTAFEQRHHGVQITLNFANASTLLQQIAQGASADVFASAAPKFMDEAVAQGLIEKDSVKIFARNRLTVILPKDNPQKITALQDLAKPGVRLILGAKEGPQGVYVDKLLTNASALPEFPPDFKEKVYQNVVSYESTVKAVVNKVMLGEGNAGIVFLTDGISAGDRIQRVSIPEGINVEAAYPIAVLKSSANSKWAQSFVDFVLSAEGQKIMEKYGFLPPK
ncbi:molybdate ABC transporter substrate-binding protein [Anaerolinea sp.]|uniref:molybdate ABC transporter substrate-binding protein n=1 Tax=Anaerolinea sp. TaxID=1872519 RepID=UPI002ACE9087|nr:molybdate ABC transporter substrate-binding protein [Anaerolinea sp.]